MSIRYHWVTRKTLRVKERRGTMVRRVEYVIAQSDRNTPRKKRVLHVRMDHIRWEREKGWDQYCCSKFWVVFGVKEGKTICVRCCYICLIRLWCNAYSCWGWNKYDCIMLRDQPVKGPEHFWEQGAYCVGSCWWQRMESKIDTISATGRNTALQSEGNIGRQWMAPAKRAKAKLSFFLWDGKSWKSFAQSTIFSYFLYKLRDVTEREQVIMRHMACHKLASYSD